MNLKSLNANYDTLKRVIIHSLEQDGSMSSEEISTVDFDSIILPFVEEMDSDEDLQVRLAKNEIFNSIKARIKNPDGNE
jgi:hypothetical protein